MALPEKIDLPPHLRGDTWGPASWDIPEGIEIVEAAMTFRLGSKTGDLVQQLKLSAGDLVIDSEARKLRVLPHEPPVAGKIFWDLELEIAGSPRNATRTPYEGVWKIDQDVTHE